MCYYLLAKHPDVQEKMYQEIINVVKAESPTFEELSQLTYMEQVINETLAYFLLHHEENKSQRDVMAFMPFGYRPQLCIGMEAKHRRLKQLWFTPSVQRFELDDKTEPKERRKEPVITYSFNLVTLEKIPHFSCQTEKYLKK
ncbi:hypothetical protein Btru_028820 [Bulinus truncatus]|nr:hypothetical protein Btru_028820 [Bulinus truncatus]